ncbi:MAG: UUP1 family membrane protein [Myxococcota bacterium]
MTRRAALTGLVLSVFGLVVFFYKAIVLSVPVVPSNPTDLWHVELSVSARGEGAPGSISALLPSTSSEQVVFDESGSSDRLRFSLRKKDGERTGVWSGAFDGVHRLVYSFRVRLAGAEPQGAASKPIEEELLRERWGMPEVEYPADAPEVRAVLDRLSLPEKDQLGKMRALQAFIVEEVALIDTASSDALLALAQSEGDQLAKARLLVTLLRAAGLPARMVRGIALREEGAPPEEVAWAQAFTEEKWLNLSPLGAFFGDKPKELLVLHHGASPIVSGTGVSALGYQLHVRRERLRPDELASMMMPSSKLLSAVSLYRTPLRVQDNLRLLLLMPIGALLVAVFRNLIGLPTFGTFMPILLALSLRTTRLIDGLLLLTFVLGIAVVARVLLNRLRLLVVPRLGVLLCLVVLAMTLLTLLGDALDFNEMFASVLFPVVILTMLVERFSLTLAEEGARSALETAGYSVLSALLAYPVFKSELAVHIMFGFPELIFTVMGLLIILGGYTGYRLVDLRRFRAVLVEP